MGNKNGIGRKIRLIYLARMAITAALYFVLTFFTPAISFGPLQFRVAEGMALLPLIFPESVFGITIGCVLANIFSPYSWYDVVFGSLITLVAASFTYLVGKFWKTKKLWLKCIVGAIPPVVLNAFGLPAMWFLMGTEEVYWINVAMIFVTEAATVWPIGTILVLAVNKIPNKS